MTNTSNPIETVIYESQNPIVPERKFCAFLVREVDEIKDRKRTGAKVKDQLPMVFWSDTHEGAETKAVTWWETERTKERNKTERGRTVGLSRRRHN